MINLMLHTPINEPARAFINTNKANRIFHYVGRAYQGLNERIGARL